MASKEQVVESGTQNNERVDDYLVLMTGVMKNLQPRGMMLNQSHIWEGRFIAEPGQTIGENSAFVSQGAPNLGPLQFIVGSKGAVIYGTFDKALPQLGWLLAWHKPTNSSITSKVYVETGNLSTLTKLKWSEVLEKLESSSFRSRYNDIETGSVATAEILDYGDNLALLSSSFDRTPITNNAA